MNLTTKVALLVGACIPAVAHAQAPAEEPAAAPAEPTEPAAATHASGDIVVTARRRAENLQDVPISVTAVTGQKLEESGVTDAVSLQNQVPSLSATTQGTTKSELGFTIRGQRTQESQLLTDPPVGTYFAEVVQARSIGFANTLYDLQSVQVLKGVQGTLFGRNMTGGAVLIEPNKPGYDFAAEVRGQVGNYKLRDLYGMINVPIAEGVAFRLAAKTRQREGYTKDISDGRDYDDQNFDTFRASLRLEPTSNIESNFIVDWNRSRTHGTALIPTAVNPAFPVTFALFGVLRGAGIPVSDPVAEFARQQTLGKYRFDQGAGDGGTLDAYGVKPFEFLKNWGITNRTTFDLGAVTIKNVASYRKVKFNQIMDLDGVPAFLINSNRFRDIKQYSEELQATGSALADRLDYVAGVYYFLEKGIDGSTSSQFPELAIGFGNLLGGLPLTTPASVFLNQFRGEGKAKSGAIYAAGSYELRDWFKISAGIRYTKDKRNAAITAANPNVPNLDGSVGSCLFRIENPDGTITRPPFSGCRQTNSKSWDAVTWDVTLQYEPTADLTTYLSTRKGFRAGGFSLRAASTTEFEPFDPESVQEYELGVKNRFRLGGGALLTANLALFYQDYRNVQKQTSGTDAAGNVNTIITNTARQHNYGGEFEMALTAGPLDLSAFYSYVDANIKAGRGPGEFGLVGAPHHQLGANATYRLPLGQELGRLAVNVNGSYRSKQHLDKNDVQATEPGYALFNARVSWDEIAGTGLGAAAFVNNITDKYYRVGVIGIFNEAGYISSTYGEPRMYGVELSYRF